MKDELERSFRDDHDRLVAVARRVLGPGEDAEDCVQDAYLAALERDREDADGLEHPRAWLTVVSRRRAVDLVRRQARARLALPRLAGGRSGHDEQPAPEDRVLDAIEAAHLVDKLQRLPPVTRQVVDLVARGTSTRDAARELDLTDRAVESHVQRARTFLRRERTPWLAGIAVLVAVGRRALGVAKVVAVPVALAAVAVVVLPRAVPGPPLAPERTAGVHPRATPARPPGTAAPTTRVAAVPVPRPKVDLRPAATPGTPPTPRPSLPAAGPRPAPGPSPTAVVATRVAGQGAEVYHQPNDAPADPVGLAQYCADHLVVTLNRQGCG